MAEYADGLATGMAVTGNNNNGACYGGGFGYGADWLWIIVIFALLGWGGNGGYGMQGGIGQNYALATDVATLERKIDGVYSGICDSTFALNNTITNGFASAQNTMTQGFAGLNTVMVQQGYENRIATNGVGTQLAQCCCEIKSGLADINYNMAKEGCATRQAIATSARDIIDSQNAGTRAILDKLCQAELEAKKEKIAEQQAQITALNLAASQSAQNAYLIDKLGQKVPSPAYVVPNPYCNCNCNNGCGCGNI